MLRAINITIVDHEHCLQWLTVFHNWRNSQKNAIIVYCRIILLVPVLLSGMDHYYCDRSQLVIRWKTWLTDVPLRLQITHRDSRRSQKKKKCTRKLERKRLLMSRDNSLKTACVSLTFLELVQKKSIPYFELWPFVLSNRGYAWLLHLPFAQQTLLLFLFILFYFYFIFCLFFERAICWCLFLLSLGFEDKFNAQLHSLDSGVMLLRSRLHSHLSSAMDSLTTVFCL